jgi:hypothetical protein
VFVKLYLTKFLHDEGIEGLWIYDFVEPFYFIIFYLSFYFSKKKKKKILLNLFWLFVIYLIERWNPEVS